jgi:predicted nucleotide-binding protein (sugar kinase/HSP70/actin superfamily)
MERDVTGCLHKGETVPNLVAGLAYSIALNYLNRVVRGRKIGNVIYFQGGTAYNDAVTAAFASLLGKKITVPPYNGVMGAIGMALIARQWQHATGGRTRFRGYDLGRLRVASRDFVCKACSNLCDMKEFAIEGQKSYWGDKCSDKFRKPSSTGRKPVIDDLFTYREQLLEELPNATSGRWTVGLPRAMSMLDQLPFWRRYFAELNIPTVLSPVTDPRISAIGIDMAVAQPCYPVQVAHGHVQSLVAQGVDYILVPNLVDAEAGEDGGAGGAAHYCPWNQTLPWVLRAPPALEAETHRFLIPTLHFQLGPPQVKNALAETMARLGVARRASDRAVDAAYAEQREFQARLLQAGARALAVLEQTGEPGLVLAGRSYNIYDRGVNCDIPRKLRHRYGANVIPLDFLVTGRESVAAIQGNMFWISGRKILEAARLTAERSNLHLVYITNFKCGPDSYIKHFARTASGAPLLILQFDGHGNDAGYMTRCEAYLDSKGILRWYQQSTPTQPPARLQ